MPAEWSRCTLTDRNLPLMMIVAPRPCPGDPDNFIVFFRDDPSVLANEASPGFVSSIIIRNLDWTPQEVQGVWENFCSSLLSVPENLEEHFSIYPNPALQDKVNINVPDIFLNSQYRVLTAPAGWSLTAKSSRESRWLISALCRLEFIDSHL